MDRDLAAVADELYGLAPEEFTAARDAQAAEARRAGDRSLANGIKRLRRPTLAAWLVNTLARDGRLEALLQLGAVMREAQTQLAADELRGLSRRRHQVVAALGRDARRIASASGRVVSEAAGRDLELTLEAALADAAAAEAVRSGRLTQALQYSGLGPLDAFGAMAVPLAPGVRAPVRTPDEGAGSPDEGAGSPDEGAGSPDERRRGASDADERGRGATEAAEDRRRAEAAAERLRREARIVAAEARRVTDERRQRLEEARSDYERRCRDVEELQRRLEELQRQAERAADRLRDAEVALDDAEGALRREDDSVAEATDQLDRLRLGSSPVTNGPSSG
jgi:hypothetical protein